VAAIGEIVEHASLEHRTEDGFDRVLLSKRLSDA
jgi:hypothetical protein